MKDRAVLGIDGNCGFALFGEDLQVGESEFEVIKTSEPNWTSEYRKQSKIAINKAFKSLQDRLGKKLPYYLDPSHPDHC